MEDINETFPDLNFVSVSKSKFPLYRTYVENGWPLPCQPYALTVNRAKQGVVNTSYLQYYPNGKIEKTVHLEPTYAYSADHMMWVQGVKADLQDRLTKFQHHKSNKLLGKVQAQALPLIQMYKERRETGKMVLSLLDKMLYVGKNIRHPKRVLFHLGIYDSQKHNYKFLRSLKKRVMSCDTVGDAFLQYRFGLTPFISDVVESYKANSKREKKGQAFHQTVGDKFSFSVSIKSDTGYGDSFTATREGWLGISLTYQITDETLASVGMIENPAAALWDLTPWSFVVDWAVDISGYLSLQSATVGTAFTTGCQTIFYKDTLKFAPERIDYIPDRLTYKFGGQKYTLLSSIPPRHDVSMTRDVLTAYPEPRLEYPLNASILHGFDLLALVYQRKRSITSVFSKKI